MANTGLRPDEVARLEFRDAAIVKDATTKETILEIEVRGKRGIGYCKSTTGAVEPFRRLQARLRPRPDTTWSQQDLARPAPTDRLFPTKMRTLLDALLKRKNLKYDRDKKVRTAYSFRHTYICFRLMEGADIYQIAKNCRTSVEMIEKHYARHIKNTRDAAAINVKKGTIQRDRKSQRSKETDPS